MTRKELLSCMSKFFTISRTFLRLILYIPVLRRECLQCRSIESFVDLAFSFRLGGLSIKPIQVKEEIMELLKILAKLKPKAVLEIGTANGGTLFLFTRVADPGAMIISVDLPGGPFGGGYPKWKIPLYKSFAKDRQEICLIRGDSHDSATLKEVKRNLGNAKLDFLFIDSDHRYEGVKKDFEMYSTSVRRGGIIAFHDIVPGPLENMVGAARFWKEIKHSFKHTEIVKSRGQGGAGIGVLYLRRSI